MSKDVGVRKGHDSGGGSAAKTFDVRLVAAAAHECVYVEGRQPPPCPEEWPGEPWKWCGACLAKAVTA